MKHVIGVLVGTLALSSVAHAQIAPPPPPPPEKGYVEAVAQSAFGNVTSQNFGAEAGYTIMPRLQLWVEFGKTRDAAPKSLGTGAQLIAGALSQSQSNVGFTVKEPVTFVNAGIRYALTPPGQSRVQPYVMGGGGFARLSKNVAFTINGTDVTSTLNQYGVVLGSDLSGESSSAMIVGGGGAVVTLYKQLFFDLQVRIGYILAEDEAISVSRVGGGIGIRF